MALAEPIIAASLGNSYRVGSQQGGYFHRDGEDFLNIADTKAVSSFYPHCDVSEPFRVYIGTLDLSAMNQVHGRRGPQQTVTKSAAISPSGNTAHNPPKMAMQSVNPWWSVTTTLELHKASLDATIATGKYASAASIKADAEGILQNKLNSGKVTPLPQSAPLPPSFSSVYVEAQLYAYGEPLGPSVRSSHSIPKIAYCAPSAASEADSKNEATTANPTIISDSDHLVSRIHQINQWLFLPITIAELPIDSVLELTVRTGAPIRSASSTSNQFPSSPSASPLRPPISDPTALTSPTGNIPQTTATPQTTEVGHVSMYVFSSKGRLKAGTRRYALTVPKENNRRQTSHLGLDSCAISFERNNAVVPPHLAFMQGENTGRDIEEDSDIENEEDRFRFDGRHKHHSRRLPFAEWEFLHQKYVEGRVDMVRWLDPISRQVLSKRTAEMAISPVTLLNETAEIDVISTLAKLWMAEEAAHREAAAAKAMKGSNVSANQSNDGGECETINENHGPAPDDSSPLSSPAKLIREGAAILDGSVATPPPTGHVNPLGSPLHSSSAMDPHTFEEEKPKTLTPKDTTNETSPTISLESLTAIIDKHFSRLTLWIELPQSKCPLVPIYHHALGDVYHTAHSLAAAMSQPMPSNSSPLMDRLLSPLTQTNSAFGGAPAQTLAMQASFAANNVVAAQGRQGTKSSSGATANNAAGGAGSGANATMALSRGSLLTASSAIVSSTAPVDIPLATVNATNVFNAQTRAIALDNSVASFYQLTQFAPKCLVPYHDPELRSENIYEAKAALLAKSRILDAVDDQPSYSQRSRIKAIINRPPIVLEPIKVDDATLLWQYRHFLLKDPKALIPFMQSLQWTKVAERREAERLIKLWRPIPLEDALLLLSRLFSISVALRRYAIEIIDQADDNRINKFLLQLVQAVRYDNELELQQFLIRRCAKNWELTSNLYWYATVESELEAEAAKSVTTSAEGTKNSAASPNIGGKGQDYISGNSESTPQIYTRMRGALLAELQKHFPLHHRRLLKQQQFLKSLLHVDTKTLKNCGKDRNKRIDYIKEIITNRKCGLDVLFPHPNGAVQYAVTQFKEAQAGTFGFGGDGVEGGVGRLTDVLGGLRKIAGGGSDPKTGGQTTAGHASEREVHAPNGEEPSSSASQHRNVPDNQSPPVQPHPITEGGSPSGDFPIDTLATLDEACVMLPSHPNKAIDGITPEGTYVFKSAKMPVMLSFLETHPAVGKVLSGTEEGGEVSRLQTAISTMAGASVSGIRSLVNKGTTSGDTNKDSENVANSTAALVVPASPRGQLSNGSMVPPLNLSVPRVPFKVMFKSGDDVRQDQLVIQFIELMDDLLKQNGLDLCLTPYRVLATSPMTGFVEVVPAVETFQTVQQTVGVAKYIQTHNPTPAQYSLAMDRFVKSCAGYCVITFLLGIGDRHLENLLITRDGRLLHIDFGFIFGRDPKPFPPPMKINKEMVVAIGGPQSEGYTAFKTYCCTAYNTLRKHSHLLLHLLVLMLDASIPDISGTATPSARPVNTSQQQGGDNVFQTADGTDPRVNLLKVQDKLRVDLNDAEATQYIQNVIADSVGSVFTNLWDFVHIAAQAARN